MSDTIIDLLRADGWTRDTPDDGITYVKGRGAFRAMARVCTTQFPIEGYKLGIAISNDRDTWEVVCSAKTPPAVILSALRHAITPEEDS